MQLPAAQTEMNGATRPPKKSQTRFTWEISISAAVSKQNHSLTGSKIARNYFNKKRCCAKKLTSTVKMPTQNDDSKN